MINTPNLFSRILSGATKIFHDIGAEIDAVYDKIKATDPTIGAEIDALVHEAKQQASNALAYADTKLAAKFTDAATMTESAADTLIMSLTHGAALPAIPLVNVGIEQGFKILHAILDHAEANLKAAAQLPPPVA